MQRERQCTKCGETKPLDEFYRDKGRAGGRRPDCKECVRERKRRWREENREKVLEQKRRWREGNREKAQEIGRRYREKNREKDLERKRRYREENSDKEREYKRRYYDENRDYQILRSKKYHHSYQVTSVALAEKRGQPYTPDEDALLLRDNGMTVYQKAVALGRTYQACRRRLQRLRSREAVDV